MKLVRIKSGLPEAVRGHPDKFVRDSWTGHAVEPYGRILPGYGNQRPHSVPHVAVRLAIPGCAAFSVVAIDEIDGELPKSLPAKPSYCGIPGCVYNADNATDLGF